MLPGGAEVQRIGEHRARFLVNPAPGDEIVDFFAGFAGDPGIDRNAGRLSGVDEIEFFKRCAESIAQRGCESGSELEAALREKSVGDIDLNRFLESSVFARFLGPTTGSNLQVGEFSGESGKTIEHRRIVGRQMQHALHFLARAPVRAGVRHREGGLDGVRRQQQVAMITG